MSDVGPENVGPAAVDPDEAQFRADTLLMHSELVELELYKIRRELFADPQVDSLAIGAGNPAEQSLRGHQADPYNGLAIFNPTQATLAIGFQVGAGYLAPYEVPPYTWMSIPARFVNLSIYLPVTADQQAAIPLRVTVVRLRVPPPPAAGSFSHA